MQTGVVRFRYFPASATVTIDGKTVSTPGTNRVAKDLSAGRHQLVLTDGTRRKARSFKVGPGETTNLGTLTLDP